MVDDTHRLAVELAQAREQRDEARRVARLAVGAWYAHQEAGQPPGCGYDEEEIETLRARCPWLTGSQGDEAAPGEDGPCARLALLEATVKSLHGDLTRPLAAMEEMGERL